MTETPQDPRVPRFEKQFADVDLEILRQAMLCGVPLENREQMRAALIRVLNNDATVCSKENPQAFAKLRAAVTMHMTVRDKAVESMGRAETMGIVDQVVERLAKRVGGKFAGPA
jgi:hypothetical protein